MSRWDRTFVALVVVYCAGYFLGVFIDFRNGLIRPVASLLSIALIAVAFRWTQGGKK